MTTGIFLLWDALRQEGRDAFLRQRTRSLFDGLCRSDRWTRQEMCTLSLTRRTSRIKRFMDGVVEGGTGLAFSVSCICSTFLTAKITRTVSSSGEKRKIPAPEPVGGLSKRSCNKDEMNYFVVDSGRDGYTAWANQHKTEKFVQLTVKGTGRELLS